MSHTPEFIWALEETKGGEGSGSAQAELSTILCCYCFKTSFFVTRSCISLWSHRTTLCISHSTWQHGILVIFCFLIQKLLLSVCCGSRKLHPRMFWDLHKKYCKSALLLKNQTVNKHILKHGLNWPESLNLVQFCFPVVLVGF